MAKFLAKSFFKEMQAADFASDHTISAAAELISLIISATKNDTK